MSYVLYDNEDNTVDIIHYVNGRIDGCAFNVRSTLSLEEQKREVVRISSNIAPAQSDKFSAANGRVSASISPDEDQSGIPKTKRRYYNPKTGKMVSYIRAKQLKLC